jgi:alanine racemase
MRAAGLRPVIGDSSALAAWLGSGGGPFHVEIDTGMSRSGFRWHDEETLVVLRDRLESCPDWEGVFTHFHSAELDDASRDLQEERFAQALAALPERPALVHAENGPAVERRAPSKWSICRPGIFLYGVPGFDGGPIVPDPVVSVRARIVEVRTVADGETVSYDATWRANGTRRIATVPVGYADGYRRNLSNRGSALLAGQRIPVAGRVTMDMTMFDVTDTDAALGDLVTLLGRDGGDVITVSEMAAAAELSAYEILTGLKLRLPRRYVADELGVVAA